MPIGPLRRLGPMAHLSDLPPGLRDPSVAVPVEPALTEDWYHDWLEEVQAHMPNPWAPDDRIARAAEITLAASATGSEVVGETLPAGHIGVWYSWSQNTAAPADYVNIRWRLLINGRPIGDHFAIVGQVSNLLNPEWLYLPLPHGARISVQVDNLSAAEIASVGCRIRAWHWVAKGKRERYG